MIMLSINQNKLIHALHQKKYRDKHGMFIIEGDKIIRDLYSSGELKTGNTVLNCATREWIENSSDMSSDVISEFIEVEYNEIKKISTMVTPPEVFSIVRMPQYNYHSEILTTDTVLVFEAIRDPGNLGSIIRTADWFGIKNIICSTDSVDAFNPKVVQSSMGGVMRVKIHYQGLTGIFKDANKLLIPIYGTTMDGDNFYDMTVQNPGLVVFGNESTGISDQLNEILSTRIKIPDHPAGSSGTESLNIAASVAVICSELRRRKKQI